MEKKIHLFRHLQEKVVFLSFRKDRQKSQREEPGQMTRRRSRGITASRQSTVLRACYIAVIIAVSLRRGHT